MSYLEKRISVVGPKAKSSTLPPDFLRMARDVFGTHFDDALAIVRARYGKDANIEVCGEIFPDEIRVTATLCHPDQSSATSAHASTDFDPTASSPKAEDLIAACIDGLATVLHGLFEEMSTEKAEKLFGSIDDLGDIPYEWTKTEMNRLKVYLRVDKANPTLDRMAEDWLAQNDPDRIAQQEVEEEEMESLIVTGPSVRKRRSEMN